MKIYKSFTSSCIVIYRIKLLQRAGRTLYYIAYTYRSPLNYREIATGMQRNNYWPYLEDMKQADFGDFRRNFRMSF
jgi:hypothetical protein